MFEKEKSPISRRLRAARTNAEFSQKKLGIKAGMDEFSASARMNQYETEKHLPDYGTIKRIAEVLNLPAAYFFCEEDDLAEIIDLWSKSSLDTRKEIIHFIHEMHT